MSTLPPLTMSYPARVMLATPFFGKQPKRPFEVEQRRQQLVTSLGNAGATVTAIIPPGAACVPYSYNLLCCVDEKGIRYSRYRIPGGHDALTFELVDGLTCDLSDVYRVQCEGGAIMRQSVESLMTFAHCALNIPSIFGLRPDIIMIDGAAMALLPYALATRLDAMNAGIEQTENNDDYLLEQATTMFALDGSEEYPAPFVNPQDLKFIGLSSADIDKFKAGPDHSLVRGAINAADKRVFMNDLLATGVQQMLKLA